MVTPIIIPTPSGSWGLGPSLLYLIGVVGAIIYVEWLFRPESPKKPDPLREIERVKAERFTQLLIEAANERKKKP